VENEGYRMSADMEQRRHELLEFVHDVVKQTLADYRIKPDVADQVGCAVADALASEWGGQLISFPKDFAYKVSARDEQIWADFDGKNQPHLAQKYGLTLSAVYRIIKRFRRRGNPAQRPLL
jgi:Mor family transcriptional regulator